MSSKIEVFGGTKTLQMGAGRPWRSFKNLAAHNRKNLNLGVPTGRLSKIMNVLRCLPITLNTPSGSPDRCLPHCSSNPSTSPLEVGAFTREDPHRALSKLKNNRAAGPDNIPAEFWHSASGSPVLFDASLGLLNETLNSVLGKSQHLQMLCTT